MKSLLFKKYMPKLLLLQNQFMLINLNLNFNSNFIPLILFNILIRILIFILSHVMKKPSLVIFVLTLLTLVFMKPVFDFSKSYVIRLTDFNINDQIHKIRRSTNQVSIVLFYKYAGLINLIQMENPRNSQKAMTNGLMNTEEYLELLP